MARSTKTALLLLVLAGVLMFVPLPETGRLVDALQDLGHVGVGALLAFFVCRVLRDHAGLGVGPAMVLSFVITAVVLAGVEFLQPVFGRSRSLADLTTGLLAGAGALTLMLAHGRDGLGKFVVWLVGMALLLAAAATPGQVLVDVARQYRIPPCWRPSKTNWNWGAGGSRTRPPPGRPTTPRTSTGVSR